MTRILVLSRLAIAAGIVLCFTGFLRADRIRVHYGQGGATGAEYVSGFGATVTPIQPKIKPNQIATFIHPYTRAQIQVPIAFPPDSTPRIQHRRDRIVFNYGSYTIEVLFLPDGSVDVIYNSGFLRPVG
jgi:hypothetical protein